MSVIISAIVSAIVATVVVRVIPSAVPAIVVPAPAPAAVAVVGTVPAVPRIIPGVVPSEGDVPDEGVVEAEATIAGQAGRVGEVAVVEAIVVAVAVTFVVGDGIVLCGLLGINVERIALQPDGRCIVCLYRAATIVFVYVAQLPDVVVGIRFIVRIIINSSRADPCGCSLLGLLLGGHEVHVIVLCLCAEAYQREQQKGKNVCFHSLFVLNVDAKLRPSGEISKGKNLFCRGNFPI